MITVTGPAELLPPIPQPPHDPTWWLLDPVAGWRAGRLDAVEQAPADGALTLAAAPGSRRRMDEPSGSFGGLVLPANAALAPTGELYLLDGRGPVVHLSYSDGLSVVSVFLERGTLDPSSVARWTKATRGGRTVYIRDTVQQRVVWASRSVAWLLVRR